MFFKGPEDISHVNSVQISHPAVQHSLVNKRAADVLFM